MGGVLNEQQVSETLNYMNLVHSQKSLNLSSVTDRREKTKFLTQVIKNIIQVLYIVISTFIVTIPD